MNKRKVVDQTLNTLREAMDQAAQAADSSMLPQTVFADAESHGWMHTWNGARRIERATEMHVTVLPVRYFT